MSLPTATMVPAGHLKMAMGRLDELAPLLGQPISGSVTADLDASPAKARLTVDVQGAALPGTASASRIALTADVDQPESNPVVDARLEADGIKAKQVGGSMRLLVNGPVDALAAKLSATLPDLSGAAARLDAAAVLNAKSRVLSVSTLQADWHQQSLRLLAPARLDFAEGVAVDRLRLGLRQAVLEVSGRVGTALDLTVSLRNLPADLRGRIRAGLRRRRHAAGGCPHHRHHRAADRHRQADRHRPARPQRSGARHTTGEHHRRCHAEGDRGAGRCPAARRFVAGQAGRAGADVEHRRSGPAGQRRGRSRHGEPDPRRRRAACPGSRDAGPHDRRHRCRAAGDGNGACLRTARWRMPRPGFTCPTSWPACRATATRCGSPSSVPRPDPARSAGAAASGSWHQACRSISR